MLIFGQKSLNMPPYLNQQLKVIMVNNAIMEKTSNY